MAFYHQLLRLVPSADDLLVPAEHADANNVRLRSRTDLEPMPWFPWEQIYGTVGYDPASDRA